MNPVGISFGLECNKRMTARRPLLHAQRLITIQKLKAAEGRSMVIIIQLLKELLLLV
jgi:hypothetical protein